MAVLDWGQRGHVPLSRQELVWQMRQSTTTATLFLDGAAAAVGGVMPVPALPATGLVWIATTDAAGRAVRTLMRVALDLCQRSGFDAVLCPVDPARPEGERLARLCGFGAWDNPAGLPLPEFQKILEWRREP